MSSRNDGSTSSCVLEVFPVEIVGRIYLYSENPSLAVVNKKISRSLSSQSIRLQFCIQTFFTCGPFAYADDETAKLRKRAQNLVLRSQWFSNSFARKLQREVLRLQKLKVGLINPLTYRHHRRVRLGILVRIPSELLLQKPWGPAKVKLIHRLLQWGAEVPTDPKYITDNAMMNAILENKYLAVNFLHEYCRVRFKYQHFQAAVLGDCDKRIVEMIVGFIKNHPLPFIERFDYGIYKKAKLLDEAGNPMGRQLLEDVFWKGFNGECPDWVTSDRMS